MMAAVGGGTHERLAHETCDQVVLPRDLRADLSVSRQTVAGAQRLIKHEVQFKLARSILVVSLNHIEPHRSGIVYDLEHDRPKRLELIDVIAVGTSVTAS